jgi:hypothetical protein
MAQQYTRDQYLQLLWEIAAPKLINPKRLELIRSCSYGAHSKKSDEKLASYIYRNWLNEWSSKSLIDLALAYDEKLQLAAAAVAGQQQ